MATDFAAWMAHLIEAHVLLACGREDEGLGALRRALQLGRAAGLYGITREEVDMLHKLGKPVVGPEQAIRDAAATSAPLTKNAPSQMPATSATMT